MICIAGWVLKDGASDGQSCNEPSRFDRREPRQIVGATVALAAGATAIANGAARGAT
jgi:hypothetical protein